MSSLFTRSLRGIGLVALVAAGAAALSCSKDETTGQLTVVIQTDLAMPKDLDYVRLEVRSDGLPLGTDNPPPLHRNDYPINPADPPELRVTIPATFAVYNAKGAVEPVAVRVIAGRGGQARILRDAITAVPSDRNAMLRMYLQWLSDGSALPAPAGSDPHAAVNACPALQTNIAGRCVDSHVDLAGLPEFSNVSIYGGATAAEGHAFDVLSCFAAPEAVTTDAACSFALPAGLAPENVNVGVELPAGSDGVCNAAHCVVPLDRQEPLASQSGGWFLLAGRVQLPAGLCARAATFPTMRVVLARECASKTAAMPLCSPSSTVTDCSIHGAQDGGGSPPSTVVAGPHVLSLGSYHTCSRSGNTAYCWGKNDHLQAGGTQGMPRATMPPQNDASANQLTGVSAGVDTTCVLRNGIYCWGNDAFGQRGLFPPIANDSAVPQLVSADSNAPEGMVVTTSGATSHACAYANIPFVPATTPPTLKGHVWCWGANSAMQLGSGGADGASSGFDFPFEVRGLALGDRFSCLHDAMGRVLCWGENGLGQLGLQTGTSSPQGVNGNNTAQLPGMTARDLVAGADFACALTTSDEVWCWGNQASGAVTGTKSTGTLNPTKVPVVNQPVKNIAAGSAFVCATTKSIPETVTCWGGNTIGQLGTTQAVSVAQVMVPFPPPYDQIVAGGERACVISGHRVACWGANDFGQITGSPSASLPPMEIYGIPGL
jgi:alpha-tubulin suppressor-like RCC1 family protein